MTQLSHLLVLAGDYALLGVWLVAAKNSLAAVAAYLVQRRRLAMPERRSVP
jgi:hypothetical protein